ncbi:MAG: PEP-CTERM sorting domain-containing protein [Verrucomicrobiota bacterium]
MRTLVLSSLAFASLACTVRAAIVDVSNANGTNNGAYAFVTSSGVDITDPPGRIFFGSFSTLSSTTDIGNTFASNFSGLVSDFVSLGSVGVEEDGGFNIAGLHVSTNPGLDVSSMIGRNLAVWLTTSGTINDTNAEHLIYLTTETFMADLPSPNPEFSYDAKLAPSGDGGTGNIAVGGFGNFVRDQSLGAGNISAFNTVAVPEPGTWGLLLLSSIAIFFLRRKSRIRTARHSSED